MKGSIRQRGSTHTAYWFTIDPGTGKRVQRSKGGFRSQKAAQSHLNAVLGRVEDGSWAPDTRATVKHFAETAWLPSLDDAVTGGSLKPTTRGFYRHLTTRHVIPRLGAVRLAELTAPRLNAFYGDLLKEGRVKGAGLSPTSVSKVHVTVHRMLRDAVKWGQLQRNVADHATPPRPRKNEMTVWSPAETRTFLEATSSDRLAALWRLLTMTGLRRGEVLGLRWADVDLEGRRLTIERSRVQVAGEVVVSTPKTASSSRSIGIDPATVVALRSHRARQSVDRLAAGEAWANSDDAVFTDELGEPLSPRTVSKVLLAAAADADLPRVRLHDLRHGYATAALEAGAPLKVVSERLGHSSIAVTANVYSHVRPEVDQALADQVADLIMAAGDVS